MHTSFIQANTPKLEKKTMKRSNEKRKIDFKNDTNSPLWIIAKNSNRNFDANLVLIEIIYFSQRGAIERGLTI